MKSLHYRLFFTLCGLAVVASGLLFNQRASAQPPFRSNQRTFLLFQNVVSSSTAGQETGITISNTSADPYGTTSVSGACTLYFYGQNPPAAAVNLPTIPAGMTYANTVGYLAPGFQGYIIANCGFPLAHGASFTSDSHLVNYMMWSQALVLPNTRNTGFAEQAAH
jgi:hypothetical protein